MSDGALNSLESISGKSKDPVCWMDVNPSSAAGDSEYGGQTYHFCSSGCLAKFEADPPKYVGASKPQPKQETGAEYTCPMHPQVRRIGPGSCPSCGMALEPVALPQPRTKIEYTCPMHPEIVRDAPGNCPICGMALEPRTIQVDESENPDLVDMRRRFWISAALSGPVLISAMSEALPFLRQFESSGLRTIFEATLATPVVLWGGWPFFVRAWQSILNRSLNMFTLIGIGVGAAYGFPSIANRIAWSTLRTA